MINEWVLRLHFFILNNNYIEIKNCPILRQSKDSERKTLSLALAALRYTIYIYNVVHCTIKSFAWYYTLKYISFWFYPKKNFFTIIQFETWITSLSYRGFVKLNSVQIHTYVHTPIIVHIGICEENDTKHKYCLHTYNIYTWTHA